MKPKTMHLISASKQKGRLSVTMTPFCEPLILEDLRLDFLLVSAMTCSWRRNRLLNTGVEANILHCLVIPLSPIFIGISGTTYFILTLTHAYHRIGNDYLLAEPMYLYWLGKIHMDGLALVLNDSFSGMIFGLSSRPETLTSIVELPSVELNWAWCYRTNLGFHPTWLVLHTTCLGWITRLHCCRLSFVHLLICQKKIGK